MSSHSTLGSFNHWVIDYICTSHHVKLESFIWEISLVDWVDEEANKRAINRRTSIRLVPPTQSPKGVKRYSNGCTWTGGWCSCLFPALLLQLHATDSLSLCLHLHVPGRLESPKHHMAIDSSMLNVLCSGLQMDSCLCVKWFTAMDWVNWQMTRGKTMKTECSVCSVEC